MAIGVPSSSIPVIASMASPMPGTLRAESICACETDPRSSTCRTALTRNAGATTGLSVVRNGPTAGSAGHLINEVAHLRQAVRRERLPAKDDGYNADAAGIPKRLVYFFRRIGNGVPGRKEGDAGALRRRSSKIRARSQNSGNAKQDDERDVRAGRDQPTQCAKQVVHGKIRPLLAWEKIEMEDVRAIHSLPV